MRRWKMILASIMAVLVLVLVPLSVMAQTTTTPATITPPKVKPDLVIVAPRMVLAGKEMQLTVFQRDDQKPVGDVNIWVVTKDKIEDAKKAIQNLMKNNAAQNSAQTIEPNYSAAIAPFGKSLKVTGPDGVLKNTFNDDGNYLLVAFKAGYRPDFAVLVVRGLPKGLAIENQKMVKPNEKVTITVHLRGSTDPVEGAGVWAISADKVADLKGLLSSALSTAKDSSQITDYAALLSGKALSLGTTNSDGQVTPQFANPGRYILVTFKTGYGPGFGTIAVVAPKPTPSITPGVSPNTRPSVTPSPSVNK